MTNHHMTFQEVIEFLKNPSNLNACAIVEEETGGKILNDKGKEVPATEVVAYILGPNLQITRTPKAVHESQIAKELARIDQQKTILEQRQSAFTASIQEFENAKTAKAQ